MGSILCVVFLAIVSCAFDSRDSGFCVSPVSLVESTFKYLSSGNSLITALDRDWETNLR